MAEEKKPEAKPAPASATGEAASIGAELVAVLIFLMILGSIFGSVSSRLASGDGWVFNLSRFTPKGILLAHTRPISSLSNPIGARVISLNKTDVHESPGGKKIGSQKLGSRGKILQGPVEINGERYWYVDYDSGPDGWVKESDIAYLETEPNKVESFIIWLFSIVGLIKLSIIVFCILCFLYILYLNKKISPIIENERKLLYPVQVHDETVVNQKWQIILNHIESMNQSDWRIAIIEADIMLEELLEKLSLPGDSIGDKLKVVERSDFTTIDSAWEAHKIRNRISHDGQNFELNQREAKIAIGLYEKVFEEFKII